MYRILLINKNKVNDRVIRRYLNNSFVDKQALCVTNSFNEGINLLKARKPHLVILNAISNKNDINYFFDNCGIVDFQTIVLSSSDAYALTALKYNVIDYLLMPIKEEDFREALIKAISKIKSYYGFDQQQHTKKINTILAIPMFKKIEFIDIKNVMYCEAQGKYTQFTSVDSELKISSKNLGAYEKRLSKFQFFRIHHKYLVNLNFVSRIDTLPSISCTLRNGVSLKVSVRRYEALCKFLQIM
ncbi:hypothetical protein BFR04_16225 [Gaetbulibacter sp. 4G1]|nr:LytTR family transcriptional regulator DNA-binding domain-containing protein [Gaetbulibacter sp. 4G1]PIA80754.1 hypothetical protein BFR04_16225 [Gaetbulibacter sp. 4G1]